MSLILLLLAMLSCNKDKLEEEKLEEEKLEFQYLTKNKWNLYLVNFRDETGNETNMTYMFLDEGTFWIYEFLENDTLNWLNGDNQDTSIVYIKWKYQSGDSSILNIDLNGDSHNFKIYSLNSVELSLNMSYSDTATYYYKFYYERM